MYGETPEVEALRGRVEQLEAQLEERDRQLAEVLVKVSQLTQRVEELTAENAALREELGKDSSNSGKPPSSDSPQARKGRKKRRKGSRRRGGQPGHEGHHRALLPPEEVDAIHNIFVEACSGCGAPQPRRPSDSPERHQVVDLVSVKEMTRVNEYRLHDGGCCSECGQRLCCSLPKGVPASPFGPGLVALIGLLTGQYRMSKRKACQLLSDTLGVAISVGALVESEHRLSRALAEPVAEAVAYVQEQPVKYCDSTTWRETNQHKHLWTIACALVTVFFITARGTKQTAQRLLGQVKGVLVSDRHGAFGFWAMRDRQVCWAHLIRLFVSFSEREGPSERIGKLLLALTHQLFNWWHRIRDGDLDRSTFQARVAELQTYFRRLLVEGADAQIAKTSGSCRHLLEHFEAMWTFVRVEGVEPTNNEAERALRNAVIWRRINFGTQSQRGSKYMARLMTAVETLRKQSRNVLEYLRLAYQAALNNAPPPSLLPPQPVGT